jgi:hypothetical protein
MEISNNQVPTLSSADSPSQLSDGNPRAKNAKKKKVPGEESSFDGALATTLIAQKPPAAPHPKALGTPDGKALAAKVKGAPDRVELSAKGKATADQAAVARTARTTHVARADGGAPVPTVASLFQAKAEQSANGPMASAFVAGPDQPWGSRWVFAGGNQPAPEEIEALRNHGGKPAPAKGEINLDQLKKLVERIKAQGGDETQLKQAAESTLKSLDSAIAAVGGKLEGVRTDQAGNRILVDSKGHPVKATPNVLGGAAYLAALQSARATAGGQGGNPGNLGGRSNGRPPEDLSALKAGPNAEKPNLQVLPGGLSAGSDLGEGRLEGGLRLAKDDPKLRTDTFFPSGAPLTAAPRPDGHIGPPAPQMLTGHVVPGEMMRERLTSESIRNVSHGISGMSGAGGGEMRIRLNPDNLGELMIRVTTNGKDVGLKVQANDPAAKKVIEESLGALRDSLAQQSLALGRVDVTLASTATSSDHRHHSQSASHGQHAFGGFDGNTPNRQPSADGFSGSGGRSSRSYESGSERGTGRSGSSRIAAMGTGGSAARRVAPSSRLDVMA